MSPNTVLVGVGQNDEDRVDELTETVRKLATDDGDRVILGHVYDEADAERLESMLDIDADDPDDVAVAVQRNTAVSEVADALEAVGIAPDFRGRFGDPGSALVDLAADEDADFLVVGGRGRSPAGKALFGSTAQEVLLSASCPVVFIRSRSA